MLSYIVSEFIQPAFVCMLFMLITCVYAFGPGIYRERVLKRTLRDRAEDMLYRVKLGAADPGELYLTAVVTAPHVPEGLLIGWSQTMKAYCDYIDALPLQTRHDIIDKLLRNQTIRCKGQYTDMATLIELMNDTERDTLMYTISDKATYYDSKTGRMKAIEKRSASDLANDVILFRFRNPY